MLWPWSFSRLLRERALLNYRVFCIGNQSGKRKTTHGRFPSILKSFRSLKRNDAMNRRWNTLMFVIVVAVGLLPLSLSRTGTTHAVEDDRIPVFTLKDIRGQV